MWIPSIPNLGLDTYRNTNSEECAVNVRTALEIGYRHIDTAETYGNKEAVGKDIRSTSVVRDNVFLATYVLHPKFTDNYSREGIIVEHSCVSRPT